MHDSRGDVVRGPLTGLRIVESSAFVAVPFAGMTMAQMGADVIRIDLLKGGMDAKRWPVTASGESLFWAGMNKGKRSLAIDFTTPEGAEIVASLITAPGPDAGIFLTNLRGKGALDYPALTAKRPDLIMVSLTGTRRGEPAVDYTVNPALGFPMATGLPGTDPVAHVLPAWDLIAGQMIVNTTLAAERHRLRHGTGQLAELSLKDVAAGVMGHLGIIGEVAVNGVDRARCGNSLYGAYGQDFVLADGNRVMVIGLTDRQWKGLVRTLGMEAAIGALEGELGLNLMLEANRWHARTRITALFTPWFAARSLPDIAPLFDAASLTWSVFRSFAGAVQNDPDLSLDNPMFSSVTQPNIGTYPVPGSPVASTAYPRAEPVPAPRLGAHTEAILTEILGLTFGNIAGLIDRKIIAI
jgi:2-methylfumaryl-CoA isomerase